MIKPAVKAICKYQGRQLYEIADALQITRQSLHRFLTGSPNLETVRRIADALNVPTWIILHPAPLAALAAWNQDRRQGQTDTAAAVIFCPYCKRQIQILTAPALATPGPSSNNTGGDPDTWPDEDSDSDQDQNNSRTGDSRTAEE